MTQYLPTLADRFAGVRQELLSGARTPGFGLDTVILALVLRLLALLEGLAQGWASGGTVRRRRRPRRGFALARAACRLHKPNARTPSGARTPPFRLRLPARASPPCGGIAQAPASRPACMAARAQGTPNPGRKAP
jgi:hypothetical protein